MSEIIGFFSYLNVMLWLAQDLFSNWTQTRTAVVSSTEGMVQVMVLSLRLCRERHSKLPKPTAESGQSLAPRTGAPPGKRGGQQRQARRSFQSHANHLLITLPANKQF